MDQSNEEQFQALLFAMGNTEMLERQTYFPADKEALLQMAYQAFQSPDKVVRLIPISNYMMRDETIWNTDDEWLGEFEWCRESMRSKESNAKNHSKDMLVQSVAVDC